MSAVAQIETQIFIYLWESWETKDSRYKRDIESVPPTTLAITLYSMYVSFFPRLKMANHSQEESLIHEHSVHTGMFTLIATNS